MSEQSISELRKVIWDIANDLRGSIDSWDFKQYILGTLFYRFISEYFSFYVRQGEDSDFNYADLDDSEVHDDLRKEFIQAKGFYILPSELFENVRKRASNDENLNETLSKIFKNIEASAQGTSSEKNIKGLFQDIDINNIKLGNTVDDRNKKLLTILEKIGDLGIGDFNNNSFDMFGDVYEHLMYMYAQNAGKSGGEFFTPQSVSELLAKITVIGKKEINKIYDPACGSGALLLRFAKLKDITIRNGYYGQEINHTTYNLSRMNMFLHNIRYDKFNIAHGNTLLNPMHWNDEPFEAIVSNPPYSVNWEGDANSLLINDERFSPAGILAPKSKGDFAFIMHALSWLSATGTAAIVCFPGIFYRGGAEQKIRKYLVDNNYIDAVIALPDNLFFGTTVATCILVMKKNKKDSKVLFVDARKEFVKDGKNNKLSDGDINNILDYYKNRCSHDHISQLVGNEEIGNNKYNLSVNRYVSAEDTTEKIDINELNVEIEKIVARQSKLREEINKIVTNLQGGSI